MKEVTMNKFQEFLLYKETKLESTHKDWRKHYIKLEKGFIPPKEMRPIIDAFHNAGDIEIMADTEKPLKMPKKVLLLTGGSVRDFLKNKAITDYDLATNATPDQTLKILKHAGFGEKDKIAVKKDKFTVAATVKGMEFEIVTFQKGKEYSDNPHDDAKLRDLTINSMYIELGKSDGENDKLFDPLGSGFYDLKNQIVKAVGNAEDKFHGDHNRVLRAIRFHARFGKGSKMHDDMENVLDKFKNLNVGKDKIKDEFMKGLSHVDTNLGDFMKIFKRSGILESIFPHLEITDKIPHSLCHKRDKVLALAWVLQNNEPESVGEALVGWEERNAVIFLLKLKAFTPSELPIYMQHKGACGLSDKQIHKWIDLFKKNRPTWAKHTVAFVNHKKSADWDAVKDAGLHKCKDCKGEGCPACVFSGEAHPDLRPAILDAEEIKKFINQII